MDQPRKILIREVQIIKVVIYIYYYQIKYFKLRLSSIPHQFDKYKLKCIVCFFKIYYAYLVNKDCCCLSKSKWYSQKFLWDAGKITRPNNCYFRTFE